MIELWCKQMGLADSLIKTKISMLSSQLSGIFTWILHQSLKLNISETKLMCLLPKDAVSPAFPVSVSCFSPLAHGETFLGNSQCSVFLILEVVSQGTLAFP